MNDLNDAEIERLAILSEELSETGQIIGKILRHGFESFDPTRINSQLNREMLEKEIGDVLYAIKLMVDAGDINLDKINSFEKEKAKRIQPYLHYN